MAFIFKHIVVGQVWMELEVSSYILKINCSNLFLLQLVSITVDSDPL